MHEPASPGRPAASTPGCPRAETGLAGVRFAVVDVETSGLSLRRHRLLQVGVVVIDAEGTVLDRWASLVHPRRRLLFRVGPRRLHGIDRRSLRSAPPLTEVMNELAQRLQHAVFVAHNAEFDIGFLRKAAGEARVQLALDEPVCTLALSRQLDPQRRLSHRLGALCDRFGVTLLQPHDALADAAATAAILPHLLAAHDVRSLAQLDEVRRRARRPARADAPVTGGGAPQPA